MTSDRWEEINRLYNAAVEVDAKERTSFLEKACEGDQELRREVESLLAYDQQAQQLLDRPAMQMAAEKLASEPASLLGRKLGPYQVQILLGSGGMGDVYKAKDTRLNRTVAIKVLPRLLSERVDLRQRFEREARAIAGLNHPNICAIHDVGRQEGIDFLVMEYLEGETLSKRLKKGPLPTQQLLHTAIEIATALDQAHRHGVMHRDLKPGNIMLTKQGAKLLDFGLAKIGGTRAPSRVGERAQSARSTESLTEEGMILGTLEYMAPEQVEGKEMDARTDIFAFGVVIYEMATGRKAFEGESKASLAAAILTAEPPPMTKIQPRTPPALERVVKRCLAKDPEDRWQTPRDLASELKWIAEAGGIPGAPTGTETAGLKLIATQWRRRQVAWALAVTFLIAAIISAFSYLRLTRVPGHVIISEILPPEKTQFSFEYTTGGPPVLSPDGAAVAFSATDASGKTMLWVRSLDSAVAQPLAGTEGAANPFWSTNGRSLGFFADGKLKTLPVLGGPAVEVAEAPFHKGGSWNREGTLLFVPDRSKGLYQVAASGGAPVPVFKLDPSKISSHKWPKFLPDGKHFLYQAVIFDDGSSGTYFASLDGNENRLLLRGAASATYASGFLLYLRNRTLMAQAFDPERGRLKGDAQPIAERVPSDRFDHGFFDASENGVLIYRREYPGEERRITWFDRAGKELSAGERASSQDVRLSTDGTRLAFNAGNPNRDLWVDELSRGVRTRLTNNPGTDYGLPVWSPDSRRILSALWGKTRPGIYQMNSNGTGGEELLLPTEPPDHIWPTSWSRDGKFIIYVRGTPWTRIQNLWVLPLAGDSKPRLFVQNAFDGQFSPDGRWVAYTSTEADKQQIYVVPFDVTKILNADPTAGTILGGKWQVSSGGGMIARWRGDGKEIFCYGPEPRFQVMAAEVDGKGNNFEARKDRVLFRVGSVVLGEYDVTPDGKRFVMTTQKVNLSAPLTLVVNWTALLGNKP